MVLFLFSSRRRHTSYIGDWSSDVCSSDLCASLAWGVADFGAGYSSRLLPVFVVATTMQIAGLVFAGAVVLIGGLDPPTWRSEERRVGKEWRSRGWRCWSKSREAKSEGRCG